MSCASCAHRVSVQKNEKSFFNLTPHFISGPVSSRSASKNFQFTRQSSHTVPDERANRR